MAETETRRIKKIVRERDPYVENMRMQRHGPVTIEVIKGERAKKELAEIRKSSAPLTHAETRKVRVVEGYVTLVQLAVERKIQSQLARLWLLKAGWSPPWRWKEGSKNLARVRKVLELPV